jgi:multiple sugar transport system substrate-binding protein/raffinose/stachyose/melibiose transport system substrate-binding protein
LVINVIRKKKFSAVVALLAAVAIPLVGCSANSDGGGSSSGSSGSGGGGDGGGSTTVKIWGYEAANQLDDEFWSAVESGVKELTGKDVDVEYRAYDSQQFGTVLQTALAGGEGPDIFSMGATAANPREYIENGLVKPLDDVVDFDGFFPQGLNLVSYDGKRYGIPKGSNAFSFFYNKKMFADRGLTPPRTWDELIKILDTFKAEGITPLASMGQGSWGEAAQLWATGVLNPALLGADYVNDLVEKKADFTDPRFLEFLKRFQSLAAYYPPNWTGLGSTGAEQAEMFASGEAAMYMVGSWDIQTNLLRIDPDLEFGLFETPTVSASDKQYTGWLLDGAWMMTTGAPAAANDVMQYLASVDGEKRYGYARGSLPAREGVEVPDIEGFAELADRVADHGLMDIFTGIASPMMQTPTLGSDVGSNAVSIQSLDFQYLIQLMRGDMTPEQVVAAYQENMKWYFDEDLQWSLR